jgi:hypothetical protein
MRAATVALAFVLAACGGEMPAEDAGGSDTDAGMRDAGGEVDAGMMTSPDAGPIVVQCGAGQHQCGEGCIDTLPNNVSNGCALGCGEPCPGPDAICNGDGTCGIGGCEPIMCEDLGVECGSIDNGCSGRTQCGECDTSNDEQCLDGSCVVVCPDDENEPNDDFSTVNSLGTLGDRDEPIVNVSGIIDPASDEDWFYYRIDDQDDGGAPEITVTLMVPPGSNYSVALFYDCDTDDQRSTCPGSCSSEGLSSDTVVLNTSCGNLLAAEHGDLYIRVRNDSGSPSCASYNVRTSVM